MKTLSRIFAIVVMFFVAATTFAQVSATSTVTGTIVTPIAISKTFDMNFGNVAVSSVDGTVVLSTAGARSATGGVTLPAVTGTVKEAIFHVTGENNYTYSITLGDIPVQVSNGSNHMQVNTFVTNPTPTGTLSASGAQDIHVGATLNVTGGQASGVYTSDAPFKVTVNYN